MVLFFLELTSRRVEIAGVADKADGAGMQQIGRNLSEGRGFTTSLLRPLEGRLAGRTAARSEAYDNIKTYLLLTSEHARLKGDEKQQQFLGEQLQKLAQAGGAAFMKPHLDLFARTYDDAVGEGLVAPFTPDLRAVAAARASAGRLVSASPSRDVVAGPPPMTR